MKRFFILILIILMAITTTSCKNIPEDGNFIETLETIIETITTMPFETVPTETMLPQIDKDITFSYEYVSNNETMPYGLFTPSTASQNDSTPLIVWLHGKGSSKASSSWFSQTGLLKVLNNWKLDGFDAYVLCPHLHGKWNYGSWNSPSVANNIQDLLDIIIADYNIDTNNIIIAGHSLGGYGAIYMAYYLPEYFSKLVILSGYPSNIDLTKINIPTIGYVGTSKKGEDSTCIKFMKKHFIPVFGEENAFSIESSHTNLPNAVFNEDKDGNNKSDVIEWMLSN